MRSEELNLVTEWAKTFPKSAKADHIEEFMRKYLCE